jgi:hypothetical protein
MSAKLRNWTTRALLIGSLASVSACGMTAGNFCEVVPGPIEFAAETSAQIVRTDRPAAVQIAAQNAYGGRHCTW